PVQLQTGTLPDGDQMQGQVGGAAGGQQHDQRIDQRTLIDDTGQAALPGARQPRSLFGYRHRQRLAQGSAGIDEGSPRQLQPHGLQQQLVGVGSAVEGTGARRVVGLAFGLQQL